jgi:hypothetical protein
MDRLTDAEELTKKMDAQLKDLTGKDADTLRKAGKAMQEEIKSIREFINGKTIERQGYGRPQQPPTPMSVLQLAGRYIGAKPVKPGAQEEQLVKDAEFKLGEAVTRINAFFSGKWADYRKLVEANPIKLFKEYQPIQ